MHSIQIINKNKPDGLKDIFTEKSNPKKKNQQEIFLDPARLLKELNLENILDHEPFSYITVAGSIWEFYLLALEGDKKLKIRQYNKLIKKIPNNKQPLEECTRTKLGNPYRQWQRNYKMIENEVLKNKTRAFVDRLIEDGLPLRQKRERNNPGFVKLRKNAAGAFLKYLLGNNINEYDLHKLIGIENLDRKLLFLLKKYPQEKLYRTVGLMLCLYGGKNRGKVSSELAAELCRIMKREYKNKNNDYAEELIRILASRSGTPLPYLFKPVFRDQIFAVGERDRVIISFRMRTWFKLMEDTLYVC